MSNNESSGPVSILEGVRVAYHFDEHGDEWVVRIHHPRGVTSVCGCPGEDEAKTVATCIAAVVAIADCTFTETIGGEEPGKVECENLVEYDALRDSANAAIDAIRNLTT